MSLSCNLLPTKLTVFIGKVTEKVTAKSRYITTQIEVLRNFVTL